MPQIRFIHSLIDWSLSGIMTSYSSSVNLIASACGLVNSDFTNNEFLGYYPILKNQFQYVCSLIIPLSDL